MTRDEAMHALRMIDPDARAHRASRAVRSRIARAGELISEASRQLPDELKERHPALPWRQMGDFGNWTGHACQSVDQSRIRDIRTRDLPELARVVNPKFHSGQTT